MFAESIQTKRRLDVVAHFFVAAVIAAGVGVFVWGADRGFDLSDEGVYLLDFQNPDGFRGGFTAYHRMGAVLFDLAGEDIATMRLVGFAMLLLATVFFGFQLAAFLKSTNLSPFADRAGEWGLVLAVTVSILPAFCWPPPTLSYNTLTGVALLFAAGSFLAALAGGVWLSRAAWAAIFAISLMVLLLVKGSSAVGLLLGCGVVLIFWPLISIRLRVGIALGLSLLAVALGLVAYFTVPAFRDGWKFLAYSFTSLLEGKGASGIIGRHAGEGVDLVLRTLRSYYFPLVVAGAGVVVLRLTRSGEAWRARVISLVVLVAVAGAAVAKDGFFAGIAFRNGSLLPYFALLLALAILAGGLPGRVAWSKREVTALVLIGLWLVAIPFFGAAGTTHRLYVNALLHLPSFFGAVVILAAVADRKMGSFFMAPAAGVLLAALAAGQFVSGFLVTPYRLATPKWEQSVPVPIGAPASTLRLDPETAGFVAEMRQIFTDAGFEPGQDVLGLFDVPGVVFACGGVSPGRPWYFGNYGSVGENENLDALQWAGAEKIRRAFVIQTADDPRVATYLARIGVRFPEEYRLVGESRHPARGESVRVWAPLTPAQNE